MLTRPHFMALSVVTVVAVWTKLALVKIKFFLLFCMVLATNRIMNQMKLRCLCNPEVLAKELEELTTIVRYRNYPMVCIQSAALLILNRNISFQAAWSKVARGN